MDDKAVCEKCGAVMKYYRKEGSCGYLCPDCGWGWVTTYYSPLELDRQKYTLIVAGANDCDIQRYKAVAGILGCNYPEARKKYISGFSVPDIPAKAALSVIRALTAAGIRFTVSPDFPHDYTK